MPTEQELHKGFMLGDWEVLPGRRVLRRGDLTERPEPKAFDVLMALASKMAIVITTISRRSPRSVTGSPNRCGRKIRLRSDRLSRGA